MNTDRLRRTMLVLSMSALLLAFGCSREPEQIVTEDNWLSEELRSIPADYGSTFLRFANLRGAKEAAGVSDYKGMETIMSEGIAPPEEVFHILVVDMPGRDYAGQIYEATGIDLWGFDSILWAGELSMHAESPHITIIRGGFDSDIGTRLEKLDYDSASYRGVTWHYAWSGSSPDFTKLRASPFSTEASKLNAIAPVGDRLLIRRWTDSMESQIDVEQERQRSLWDEEPYRELAQAVGSDIVAGAFVTPANAQELWSTFGYNFSPHRLPGFAPGSDSWGTLGDYSLAIVGYGIRDQKEYTTFALYYGDPEAAGQNAAELELRLRTAQLYLYNDSVNVPKGNDESFHYPPLASFCEQLNVGIKFVMHSDYSVLVADCEAPRENGDVEGINGLTASRMWSHILMFNTLHFLVPDVREDRPWWRIF